MKLIGIICMKANMRPDQHLKSIWQISASSLRWFLGPAYMWDDLLCHQWINKWSRDGFATSMASPMKSSDIHFSHPDCYYSQPNQGNHISSIPIGSHRLPVLEHQSNPPFIPSPFPWPVAFSWAPCNYLFERDTKGSIIALPKHYLSLARHWAILSPTLFFS